MTEHDIQTKGIKMLKERGAIVIRVNSGGSVSKRGGRIRLAEKGTADTIALYNGVYLAIEWKDGDNTATPEQIAFLESVAEAGGVGLVAYDVETVSQFLEVIDICGKEFTSMLNDIKNFSSKIHFDVFEKRIFLSLHEGLTYSANSFERVIAEAWYDIFGEEK